jgi:endonuclease YncB( thermonuclease family)
MGSCQSINKLKTATNEIDFFSFSGKTFDVKVVDVYDGDTCTVVFKYKDELIKYKVRCIGYDSPEMKPSKNLINIDLEIIKAIYARNYFINQVTNIKLPEIFSKTDLKNLLDNNTKIIKMNCKGFDKYGRLLGVFIVNDVNINEEMIKQNYGYKYNGGKKQ